MTVPVYTKVRCPYCGYEMPIYIGPTSVCRGVLVRCKGQHCKRLFEIRTKAR